MPLAPYDSVLWDQCYLGPDLLPGVSSVSCGKARNIDQQKSKGYDGARLTDCGYELGTVTITNRTWQGFNDDQKDALDKILPKLMVLKNQKIKSPLQIVHPNTQAQNINYVWIKDVKLTNPDKQIYTIIIECIEWVDPQPPGKTTTTPQAQKFGKSQADVSKSPPDPTAPLK